MPKKDDLTSLSDKIKFIEKEMKDLEVQFGQNFNFNLETLSFWVGRIYEVDGNYITVFHSSNMTSQG